jgi:hypothetical protein
MLTITHEDIEKAERILNIPNEFDKQRRDIIQCMESRDIVACPGSGKTTVLLAKLIILASRMPLDNNKGICVLTHTNVAIDEIRDRLGDMGSILLSYPNYIGTIQSFVDRYLAIPACIKYYGLKPVIIDTDAFNAQFIKTFSSIYKYKGWEEGFRAFCDRNYVNVSEISLKDNCIYKGKKLFEFKKEADKKYDDKLKKVFRTLSNQGILRYEMAFELATKYLSEYKNELKPIFENRFPFVFIDEMQDTTTIQMELLDKVFNKNKISIQRFGDPEQAIYDDDSHQETAWIPCNKLTISDSKRFNNNIARVADCIAVSPHNMSGVEDSIIPPIIITYANNDVKEVLQIFARLIMHFNLQYEEKPVFKAVGMRKSHDKLGITHYYPLFNKINSKTNVNGDFSCLSIYLSKLDAEILKKQGCKAYYDRFINAILKTLRLAGIKTNEGKYYAKSTFLKTLKENDERLYYGMHKILARCILLIETGKNVLPYFRRLLIIILKRFGCVPNVDVLDFINNIFAAAFITSKSDILHNIYEFNGISIEIDTVHGVKSQTHCATLYMETVFHEYTVENIIGYFIGKPPKKHKLRAVDHLKIAYVAMTRPRKLLCVTMKEEVFEKYKKALQLKGWVNYNEILHDKS